ncbi:MAG: maleylpyruvate isomerase family mycothiol-dependent enzyme [Acidimicrobiaceae bacterium]|nr:maleylpyruvate isomerase family mycothiol-dependent enzyme [Acidimicrobiaceae bacterium]MCY4279946.1 maleylpyruvate isomerase family mycothiol-dependent enzyme [Acidimicrobiaceae bacterium]MCY4294212.1 maleylpyruvate isomerase family mycothiol-dependent enzyme [Acidimicrobiaceae bacterium]
MDAEAIVKQIEADGRRLIEVARRDLDAAVPTCAGWNLRDLAGHMGRVHAMVACYVAGRATGPLPPDKMPKPPADDTAADFAAEALERVTEALAGVEPDTEIWNWSPRPDAGFYFRRMLHETGVHRWDAENAMGDTGPVDGEQGSDGVDEFFEFVLPNAQTRKPRDLPAGSLHVHRSDGDGEWFVCAEGDEVLTERVHRKGDAAVRGPGGALFLAMWNRLPLDDASLSVMGDEAVARAWAALAP